MDFFSLTLLIPFPPKVQAEKSENSARCKFLKIFLSLPSGSSFLPVLAVWLSAGLRGGEMEAVPANCFLYHSSPALAGSSSHTATNFCNSVRLILHLDSWSLIDLQVKNSISCIHADLQIYVLHVYKPMVGDREEEGRITYKLVQCMILNSTFPLHIPSKDSGLMASARSNLSFH